MQAETKKTTVILNGVSVASLCLALGLAREDIDFLLIDEKSEAQTSDQLLLLFPATISQLRKLDVRSLVEEDIQYISHIHYFTPFDKEYRHTSSLRKEVSYPAYIELSTLMSALIDLLEEYDQKILWNTGILDYKDRDGYEICTMFNEREKFLYKADYLVASKNKDNTLILQSSLKIKDLKKPLYVWEGRFPQAKIVQIQEDEKQPSKQIYTALKQKFTDGGNINVLLDQNKSLSVTDFFDEVVLHFSSPEMLHDGEVERDLQKLLTVAFAKLGEKIPAIEITESFVFQSYRADTMQQHAMYAVGESANGYPSYFHSLNQACADADNLLRKIILAQKYPHARKVLASYAPERMISHKTDHRLLGNLFAILYNSGIAGFFSRMMLKVRLSHKKVKRSLRVMYIGSRDQYPESSLCVEEYPSFKQMAPRNRATDVTWVDGRSFFQGPKAGYQAPSGYLVFQSNEPKQNRRELLVNHKHTLLIFEGMKSKNNEKIDKLHDELSVEYKDFMNCYRITTHYDISTHDENDKIFGDPDSRLHYLYTANKSSYYLIRPDGVIAFRSCGLLTEKLRSYIESLIGKKEAT